MGTTTSRPRVAFGPEPDEGVRCDPQSSGSSKKLFAAEKEESDDSDDDDGSSSSDSPATKPCALNFGWSNFHKAAKATFNRRASEMGKPPSKKRPYNNEGRAAKASYSRSGDVYKQNGLDPERVTGVLSSDQCLCDFANT